jgi:hypothetical protein
MVGEADDANDVVTCDHQVLAEVRPMKPAASVTTTSVSARSGASNSHDVRPTASRTTARRRGRTGR